MADNVNHPKHYVKEGRKECIDEIHDMLGDDGTICFCLGNVHKYLYRMNDKGTALNNVLKAEWYANYAHKLAMCASCAIAQKYLPRIQYYKAEIEKAIKEMQSKQESDLESDWKTGKEVAEQFLEMCANHDK